jgi:hypothetical protein
VRIEFKTEGGIAHFPGLSKPIVIDTAQLPEDKSKALEALIDAARFFDLPAAVGQPRPGAADYRTYSITVTDGARRHSIKAYDPIENDALRALIDALRTPSRRKP